MMSRHSKQYDRKAGFLRRDAEGRLKAGSSPPANGFTLDQEALTLLYEMARDPERSSDALRLLQELQVHQVELDLQREELANNEHELRHELALYKTLFEQTPDACLVTTTEGRIIEANPAAAHLLGIAHDELLGRRLHEFMKPKSGASWSELLEKLTAGEPNVSGEMLVGTGNNNETVTLRLTANFSPDDVMLLAVASREPVFHDFSSEQRTQ